MAAALDVATYILQKQGSMTAMKLQKLVYYAQAWSLVWDDEELFPDRIEAWANGPVVRSLYDAHCGKFQLGTSDIGGDPSAVNDQQKDTINRVLAHYGHRHPQWLSDLTHNEGPWTDARGGLSAGARSNAPITPAAMAEYYGSL